MTAEQALTQVPDGDDVNAYDYGNDTDCESDCESNNLRESSDSDSETIDHAAVRP